LLFIEATSINKKMMKTILMWILYYYLRDLSVTWLYLNLLYHLRNLSVARLYLNISEYLMRILYLICCWEVLIVFKCKAHSGIIWKIIRYVRQIRVFPNCLSSVLCTLYMTCISLSYITYSTSF